MVLAERGVQLGDALLGGDMITTLVAACRARSEHISLVR
jgi:hypothetical protein